MIMEDDLLPTTLDGKCWRLAEECSEVIKVVSKLRRHGPRPRYRGTRYDNVADLHEEMKHVLHAYEELKKELGE